MSFDIFRVDWITVDSIIIIGLILILIAVKIIKQLTRWRHSFANEKIHQSRFNGNLLTLNSQKIKVNYCSFIQNVDVKKNQLPYLLILRTRRKSRLLHALIEGIASYGINVIDLKLEILIKERTQSDLLEDLSETIHLILNSIDQETNKNYLILTLREKPINTIIREAYCRLQIFINPKLSQMNYNMLISNFRSNSNHHLIISEYSLRFIKNRWYKYFFKEDQETTSNLTLIKRATYKFKHYETLLFGSLMELIIQKLKNE